MAFFIHRTCAIIQWLEGKWSRRVSISVCGHSVKKPKTNQKPSQNQKTHMLQYKKIRLNTLSAHNTNSEHCCHSTLLFHLLCTFQGLCLLCLLGEKNHFEAKRSPYICTAVRQSNAEKARRKPYTKAKIKTQRFTCLAFTDPLFGVSCQWSELFSSRKHEIKASVFHARICVICSSALF